MREVGCHGQVGLLNENEVKNRGANYKAGSPRCAQPLVPSMATCVMKYVILLRKYEVRFGEFFPPIVIFVLCKFATPTQIEKKKK